MIALVIAAAVAFGSADTARAECGDHVTVLHDGGSTPPDPVRTPCHGPNCSAQKSLPVAPVTLPPGQSSGGSEPAFGCSTFDPGDTPGSTFPADPSCGPTFRLPSVPFHPPRSAG